MFIYDLIKIRYSSSGFLPNIPYHLISDKEMFNAFIHNDMNYFNWNYPDILKDTDFGSAPYETLKTALIYHVDKAIASIGSEDVYIPPDWVLSYMLGNVIGKRSDYEDIHDLGAAFGITDTSEGFTEKIAAACYYTSKRWLLRSHIGDTTEYDGDTIQTRPPTMFGEPHVVKAIRLNEASPYAANDPIVIPDPPKPYSDDKITVYYSGLPHDATYTFNTLTELTVWLMTGIIDGEQMSGNSCKVIIGENVDMSSFAPSQFARDSHITSIQLNESVTRIPDDAFNSCYALRDVKLGSKVKSIGNRAFANTMTLRSINLPTTLEYIGDGAFSQYTASYAVAEPMTSVQIPKGVTYIGNQAFRNRAYLQSVEIESPMSVTFGEETFANCFELTSFTIPSGVKSIPNYMFRDCKKLSTVVIPSTVLTIGSEPLSGAGSELSQMSVYLGNRDFTPWDSSVWGNSCPASVTLI